MVDAHCAKNVTSDSKFSEIVPQCLVDFSKYCGVALLSPPSAERWVATARRTVATAAPCTSCSEAPTHVGTILTRPPCEEISYTSVTVFNISTRSHRVLGCLVNVLIVCDAVFENAWISGSVRSTQQGLPCLRYPGANQKYPCEVPFGHWPLFL